MKNSILIKIGGSTNNILNGNVLVVDYIKSKLTKYKKVIVVVSAFGRVDSPYSTDKLNSLVSNRIEDKDRDRLLSLGETISSIVLGDRLLSNDVNARILTTKEIGITTNNRYTNADIIDIDVSNINSFLDSYDCLVIPGYQSLDVFGHITTLGRGGSDTTALALATKLKLDKVELVKDVSGIYEIDPNYYKESRLIKEINYLDVLKVTQSGSRIIHDKAAKYIRDINCEIVLKSLLSDACTVISKKAIEFKFIAFKEIKGKYKITCFSKGNENVYYCAEENLQKNLNILIKKYNL